jgi:hypothetical protein
MGTRYPLSHAGVKMPVYEIWDKVSVSYTGKKLPASYIGDGLLYP